MSAPRWARTRITECCETLRLGVQRRNLKNGYCGKVSAVISHRKNRRCSVVVQAHVQPTVHRTTRGPTEAKSKRKRDMTYLWVLKFAFMISEIQSEGY